eukprot:TRINITY_DN5961_c0_g1_i1.p1 TRINITY_DN5961_c0_g1~~TRINITY_DN5961_c0_g1_i1.p1  ORF type:complete len:1078 (+),score=187.83 TRINITY_DN5961_c0_g1_i1:45-3236(+)
MVASWLVLFLLVSSVRADPRENDSPGASWCINFQDPAGNPTTAVVMDSLTCFKAGTAVYSTSLGYGWLSTPSNAHRIHEFDAYASDVSDGSAVTDDYGRVNTFEFSLPAAVYNVSIRVGRRTGVRKHKVVVEGTTVVDETTSSSYVWRSALVTVTDKRLTVVVGITNEVNAILAMKIKYQGAPDACAGVVCTALSQCHNVGTCTAGVCSNPLKAAGSTCNDGNANTIDDVCDATGKCAGNTWNPSAGTNVDTWTFQLSASTAAYNFWTTLPSRKVFQDDPLPSATGSRIKVFAAKNEFEPFVVVVRPTATGSVTVTAPTFPNGITVEINQVKYVTLTTKTDYTGRLGANPDPLKPVPDSASVAVTANVNTAFWFTVFVPPNAAAGDFSSNAVIGGVSIPVDLHVFNFQVPAQHHVHSFFDSGIEPILAKYSVPGSGTPEYWKYVDLYNQFFYDHRMAPTNPLWPGGLTAGGEPFISYNCTTHTFSDTFGVWGFEANVARWISGSASRTGVGFPSFTASKFKTNTPSQDQRPATFCGQTLVANNYDPSGAYNKEWYNYVKATRDYLNSKGLLSRGYYYFANEPQNQADYDAIAWNAQSMKSVAPDYKLAISEEPKPEIWAHPSYPGAKIDIWVAHYGNALNLSRTYARSLVNEETWWYFLHGTIFPRINPITIDHPGFDARAMGWAMWRYRLRGVAYYQWNNWGSNVWTPTPTFGQNGNTFLVYPPAEDNSNIPYGSNGHRFVPSIRWELMRDSLEDFEYFWLLNGNAHANGDYNPAQDADRLVGQIVGQGTSTFNRDDDVVYTIRKLVGQKLAGEIASFPVVVPKSTHPRQDAAPGNYYINFQNPLSDPLGPIVYNGITFSFKIGADLYNDSTGYGWSKVADGNLANYWDQWTDHPILGSSVIDDYGRENLFEFALPNGRYNVTVLTGKRTGTLDHYIVVEGTIAVNEPTSNGWIWRSVLVDVRDKRLTISTGKFGIMDPINALMIEYKGASPPLSVAEEKIGSAADRSLAEQRKQQPSHALPIAVVGAVVAVVVAIVAILVVRRQHPTDRIESSYRELSSGL